MKISRNFNLSPLHIKSKGVKCQRQKSQLQSFYPVISFIIIIDPIFFSSYLHIPVEPSWVINHLRHLLKETSRFRGNIKVMVRKVHLKWVKSSCRITHSSKKLSNRKNIPDNILNRKELQQRVSSSMISDTVTLSRAPCDPMVVKLSMQ